MVNNLIASFYNPRVS